METLKELGLSDLPVLTVFNKVDGLTLEDGSPVQTEDDLATLATEYDPGVPGEVAYTSAVAGLGIDALRERLLYEFFGARGDGLEFELDEDDAGEAEPAGPADLGIPDDAEEGAADGDGQRSEYLAG